MKIKTEFVFILPKEIDDESGNRKKVKGIMRLAKVKDILDVFHDVRVKKMPSYFYVVILVRLIKRLDDKPVNSNIIENLSPDNFAFLVDFFNEINNKVIKILPIQCSNCKHRYIGEINISGEL